MSICPCGISRSRCDYHAEPADNEPSWSYDNRAMIATVKTGDLSVKMAISGVWGTGNMRCDMVVFDGPTLEFVDSFTIPDDPGAAMLYLKLKAKSALEMVPHA